MGNNKQTASAPAWWEIEYKKQTGQDAKADGINSEAAANAALLRNQQAQKTVPPPQQAQPDTSKQAPPPWQPNAKQGLMDFKKGGKVKNKPRGVGAALRGHGRAGRGR